MNKKIGFYSLALFGTLVQPVHGMLGAFKQPLAKDCKHRLLDHSVAESIFKANTPARKLEEKIRATPSCTAAAHGTPIKTLKKSPLLKQPSAADRKCLLIQKALLRVEASAKEFERRIRATPSYIAARAANCGILVKALTEPPEPGFLCR